MTVRPFRHRRRAPGGVWALALGVAVLLGAACQQRGRPIDPGPASFWLASTGFHDRADWPSTVVQMDREEMGGAVRVTFLLDDVPGVVLLPARGEGWGVHFGDASGEPTCELDVWLNGGKRLRVPSGRLASVDAVIAARALTGLEIHAGREGPVQDAEGCGALLLWSEEAYEPWQPPFRGRVVGRVSGEAADTVVAVRLEPDGQRIRPDGEGRYELAGVAPGLYEVVFMSASGPLLRRWARVYAYADTRVDAEVERVRR